MKNLYGLVSFIGILAVVPIIAGDSPAQTAILKQFEVDQYNNVIKPYDRVDKQRGQAIVENLGYLRLECHANYPVQWIYTGNGIPIVNTDISFSKSLLTIEKRNDDLKQYVASGFLGPLREHHTGKYQCSRTDYVTLTPNLYIYVPGEDLFTSPEGKKIQINPSEVLMRPVTTSSDAIVYDPRKGFRINLKKVENPEGRYICTARYNDILRDVEYTLTSESIVAANYEEFKQKDEETCTGSTCKQCETHTDCPPLMNCYTDNKCRDPCTYSIECGKAALCRVVDFRPHCYCPPGFIGDATKQCLNIPRERYERNL